MKVLGQMMIGGGRFSHRPLSMHATRRQQQMHWRRLGDGGMDDNEERGRFQRNERLTQGQDAAHAKQGFRASDGYLA